MPLPLTSAVAMQELLARLAPAPGQAPGHAPNQARAPRPRRPAWRDATDEQVAALFCYSLVLKMPISAAPLWTASCLLCTGAVPVQNACAEGVEPVEAEQP